MDLPRFYHTMALAPHGLQLVFLAAFGFSGDLQGQHWLPFACGPSSKSKCPVTLQRSMNTYRHNKLVGNNSVVSLPFCTDSSYASDDASDATDFSSAAAINQHPPTRVSRQRSVCTFKKIPFTTIDTSTTCEAQKPDSGSSGDSSTSSRSGSSSSGSSSDSSGSNNSCSNSSSDGSGSGGSGCSSSSSGGSSNSSSSSSSSIAAAAAAAVAGDAAVTAAAAAAADLYLAHQLAMTLHLLAPSGSE